MNTTLDYYNQNANELLSRYQNAEVSQIHNLLINSFNKDEKLLELGFGTGRDMNFMLNEGFDVIGFDGSTQMIENAIKDYPNLEGKVFKKILPLDLDFNQNYDGIYAIALLMHFNENELKKIFKTINSHLYSGGKLFFSVPLKREDLDKDGFDDKNRYFLIKDEKFWLNIVESFGFKLISKNTAKDGLERTTIVWISFLFIRL